MTPVSLPEIIKESACLSFCLKVSCCGYFPKDLHDFDWTKAGCGDNVINCAGASFEQLIDLLNRVFGIQSLPCAMGEALHFFSC